MLYVIYFLHKVDDTRLIVNDVGLITSLIRLADSFSVVDLAKASYILGLKL